MNYIRDFDERNGKSGGRVLFTGIGLKSGVCGLKRFVNVLESESSQTM